MSERESEFLQGPVLQSLIQFVNELSQSVSKREEEKYYHDIHSQRQHIRKLCEEIDNLKQQVSVKDAVIRSLNDELCARGNGLPASSVYTTRQGDKALLLRHSNPKYGGELRPGTITHEDVQKRFNNFFSSHRRHYGSKLVTYDRMMYSIPCIILKLAFEYCKDFLLRLLTTTILQHPMDESFQKVIEKLRECAKETHPENVVLFMDSRLVAMKELEGVFAIPSQPPDGGETITDYWKEKKSAFFTLLNYSNIEKEKDEMFVQTKTQIVETLRNESFDKNMIDEGIDIAFSMVTLVPPVLICHPSKYVEDWVEPRINYWNSARPKVTIYFRPALFYSSNAGIGSKGEVGNTKPLGKVDHSMDQPPSSSRLPPRQSAILPSNNGVSKEQFPLPPLPLPPPLEKHF